MCPAKQCAVGGGVQPGERLIEQEEIGVLRGGLSEQRALPLAPGEVAEAAVG
jgi:hypothetical protein